MPKRTVQIAPRTQIGPCADFLIPQTITLQAGETEWIARLDPNHDYPTCVWAVRIEYSLDNEATWHAWRGDTDNGMVLTEKGVYQSIGGTFPDDGGVVVRPTSLRFFVSLSEQIVCGLVAVEVA